MYYNLVIVYEYTQMKFTLNMVDSVSILVKLYGIIVVLISQFFIMIKDRKFLERVTNRWYKDN